MRKIWPLLTCYDKILVISLILFSITEIIWSMIVSVAAQESKYVIVEVDNQVVERILVRKTDPANKVRFTFTRGEGVIEIYRGRARLQRMPQSICPQQICSKMGWIEREGQLIVCIPNRIVVRIEEIGGDRTGPKIDAITR